MQCNKRVYDYVNGKNVITFDDGTLMGFIDCIPEPNA